MRSPDRFEPAMIPVTDGKKIASKIVKDVSTSAGTCASLACTPGTTSPVEKKVPPVFSENTPDDRPGKAGHDN